MTFANARGRHRDVVGGLVPCRHEGARGSFLCRLPAGRAPDLGGVAMRRGSVLLAVALLVGACNPFATKGTVPPPPPGGGVVDPQGFPDYIAAWNRDGTAIAGYVPKSCLFPTARTGPGIEESC